MANTVRCDHCGYVEADEGRVGWLHVDVRLIDVRPLGDPPNERDYCSVDCLFRDMKDRRPGTVPLISRLKVEQAYAGTTRST